MVGHYPHPEGMKHGHWSAKHCHPILLSCEPYPCHFSLTAGINKTVNIKGITATMANRIGDEGFYVSHQISFSNGYILILNLWWQFIP